jgi:hypothetical protein
VSKNNLHEITLIAAKEGGDILCLDGVIMPVEPLPVYANNDHTKLIGMATLSKNEKEISAKITWHPEKLDPELMKLMDASLSGKILLKKAGKISKSVISSVSLNYSGPRVRK